MQSWVLRSTFKRHTILYDDASQLEALGPLFRTERSGKTYRWPVTARGLKRVDMRLFNLQILKEDLEDDRGIEPKLELMRPAAQRLIQVVQSSNHTAFGFVAVGGNGKTSSIIDTARFHYVILVTASASTSGDQTYSPLEAQQ